MGLYSKSLVIKFWFVKYWLTEYVMIGSFFITYFNAGNK